MNKRKSFSFGFTIIELLIVIVVIGILSAIGIMSYSKVQQSSRDAKRSSSISTIAEALENYYQKNGEYPSCTMMSGDSEYVSKTVLSGNIAKDVLSTPTTTSGTNSIQAACADLNAASSDLFSYIGDSSTNCTTGTSCSNYVLKYKEENTGNIITVKSRYGNEVSFAKAFKESAFYLSEPLISQLADGNYLVAARSNDFVYITLSKYTPDGNNIWTKRASGAGAIYNKGMKLTSDGGCVLVGYMYGSGAGGRDAYIVKYNSDGNIEWTKTWGSTDGEFFNSVIQSADGGYLAVGGTYYYNTNYSDTLMVKFDKSGNLIWNRTWGGSSDDELNAITKDDSGNYIVAGKTCSYTGSCDVLLQKISLAGDIIWCKISGGLSWDRATDIVNTFDNGIAISGITDSSGAGDDDILFMKFDSNGLLLWSRTWGNEEGDTAASIQQTIDGDYYISGVMRKVGSGQDDGIVLKYNKDGSLIWSRAFVGGSHDYIESVSITNDNGLVAAGFSQSFELANDSNENDSIGSSEACHGSACVLGAISRDVATAGSGDPAFFMLKFKPSGLIDHCSLSLCSAVTGVSGSFSAASSIDGNRSTNNPNGIIGTPVITEIAPIIMTSKDLLKL